MQVATRQLTDDEDGSDEEDSPGTGERHGVLPEGGGGLGARGLDLLKGAVYSNHPLLKVHKQNKHNNTYIQTQ